MATAEATGQPVIGARVFLIRYIIALVALLCLASCGGKPAGNLDAQLMAGRVGQVALVATAVDASIFTRKQALADAPASTVSATATQLFDLGESAFAVYFPSKQPSRTAGTFAYRQYPETGAFLIVNDDLRVYVMGGPFGPQIIFVGMATDFLKPPQCTPVVTGFNLQRQNLKPITEGGDAASADGGTGADGTLGGIQGADVRLFDARAQLVGSGVSDDKGLVTLRACGAVGPFYIEYRGNSKARYFDEGVATRDNSDANAWVPFGEGDYIGAWVETLSDHHVTVSALTHIAAQQVNTPGGSAPPRSSAARSDRTILATAPIPTTAAAVRAANERVRALFNQQFAGSGLVIDDITRMPALAYGIDSLRSFGNDARGQHAQALSSLAKSAAQFNPGLPNPAREMARQLERDLTDGTIDGRTVAGETVAPTAQRAYDFAQLKPALVQQAAGRLTTQTLGQGTVTVVSASQGSVSCGSGSGVCYPFGTEVTLRAQAAPGWTFQGWSGACSGSGNCQATMSGDKSVTATFITTGPVLTIARAGAGSGTVTSTPSAIDCGAVCAMAFPQGTSVTLVASPTLGSTFSGWSEPLCGQRSSCTVTVSAARTLTATFATGLVLNVAKAGTGSGTVTSGPSGIVCGTGCAATFVPGASVTLTAEAAVGSTFTGWSEPLCLSTTCTVTMSAARSVTANFTADVVLSVTRQGSGTVSGGGINCGTVCSAAFAVGAQTILNATPAPGFVFTGWSGACTGTTTTCSVTMNAAQAVTATFGEAPPNHNLVVTTVGNGSVTLSAITGLTNCGSSCTTPYPQGTVVSLQAIPPFGNMLVAWGGDCTGNGNCSVTMSADRRVTATFGPLTYTLGGTVSGLSASGLELGNAGQNILVAAGSSQFTFGPALISGRPYAVSVVAHPAGLHCVVNNGSGTTLNSNVSSVMVVCTPVGSSRGWAWMGGSDLIYGFGVYGTRGVGSASNIPENRQSAASWKDASGHLWLFGGLSGASYGNDLWRFNPVNRTWTWLGGSIHSPPRAIYGVQGQGSTDNIPGDRVGASSWVDAAGNFWLFGGDGKDSQGVFGLLNDLWRYTPATGTWTWVHGSRFANDPGSWGTLGTVSASRTPSARTSTVSWVDRNGNFWLFGGHGNDANGARGPLGDLWKFDTVAGAWGWMGGSNLVEASGIYGSRGVPSPSNWPGARYQATATTDLAGNFWLFGGSGSQGSTWWFHNDLWRYDPVAGVWTWMSGSMARDAAGVYGVPRVPNAANVPGSREGIASWTDASGDIWLFGGRGTGFRLFNDLWRYSVGNGLWTWMGGTNQYNVPGIYGSPGVASEQNLPGGLAYHLAWYEPSSGVWLFGGRGPDRTGSEATLNGFWRLGIPP